MRILILGGTTEASALVEALADVHEHAVILSLAGRTRDPASSPVLLRSGGFGGAEGLAKWLRENRTDLLVDATHPFASRMSRNAVVAADMTGTPLITLLRPAWKAVDGDCWSEVDDLAGIAPALGEMPRRVFLTTGSTDAAAIMKAAPQHAYLVRSIEPVPLPPNIMVTAIFARGPFHELEERALLEREQIEVLVSKNAGGEATYGKIAAARSLRLPVVMVRRPVEPDGERVATVPEALTRIARHAAAVTKRGV